MCTEFQAIERYLNLCDELNVQEDFLMNPSDQRVPRISDHCEESLYENPKDESQETEGIKDPWINLYGVKNTPVYPPDVVYDQELSNESPPDLLDLDQYNEAFYENWETKGDNLINSPNVSRNDFTNECDSPTATRNAFMSDSNLQTFGSIVFDHKSRHIEEQCQLLNISPDPRDWSCHHVIQWIASVCRQYEYPLDVPSAFEKYGVKGQDLCSLTEADFIELCPEAGSLLFSELEMWKTVRSLNPQDAQYENVYYPLSNNMPEVKCEPCLSPSYSDGSSNISSASSSLSSSSAVQIKMEDVVSDTWGLSTGVVASQPRQPRRCEHKQTIQLWRFLRELLHQPEVSCGAIKWVDQTKGIFKIEDSSRVAKLWGKRKNRPLMNYDKLSRSIRQYYKKGIIKKTEHSKRLVYQFCDGYL